MVAINLPCSSCNQSLPVECFDKATNTRGRQSFCRPCMLAYNRKRHAAKKSGEWMPWSAWRSHRSATDAATVSPRVRDLAWAAGFLEGEGTFNQLRQCARVSAAQVTKEPLQALKTLFGGSISEPRIGKNSKQAASTWAVAGARARGVLMTLYPFMSPRRQQQFKRALGY